ncbi:hypothetical protein DFH06DRAFT_1154008 [Mycena polygramma]|nr:hypothetical protein DFH06DRAFT_1154008 [Mycena polygramma]
MLSRKTCAKRRQRVFLLGVVGFDEVAGVRRQVYWGEGSKWVPPGHLLPFVNRRRRPVLGNRLRVTASQAPRYSAHEDEAVLDILGETVWYILCAELRRGFDPLKPRTRRRHERNKVRVCGPDDQPLDAMEAAPEGHISSWWREERATRGIQQECGGGRSICICDVKLATRTGEELDTPRAGGGVLDEVCALQGVLLFVAVVDGDCKGASFSKVPTDVRDPSKIAHEGRIRAVDVQDIFDVGIGGDPEVAKDDRKHNIEPVATDQHPARHRMGMSVTAGRDTAPSVVDNELDQFKRQHGRLFKLFGRSASRSRVHPDFLLSMIDISTWCNDLAVEVAESVEKMAESMEEYANLIPANSRERLQLQKLVDKQEGVMKRISDAEKDYGYRDFMPTIQTDIHAAKKGLSHMDPSWGAYATRDMLNTIGARIDEAAFVLELLHSLRFFGTPQGHRSAGRVQLAENTITRTWRVINQDMEPHRKAVEADSGITHMLRTISDVYVSSVESSAGEKIGLIRKLVERALSPKIQPWLFGVDVARQALKDRSKQRLLGATLTTKSKFFLRLDTVLEVYAEHGNPLATALRPATSTMAAALATLEAGLSYRNVRETSIEFFELEEDFRRAYQGEKVRFIAYTIPQADC